MIKRLWPYLDAAITGDHYAEPFAGGGSTFLHVARQRPKLKISINDKHADVANFWSVVSGSDASFNRLCAAVDASREPTDDPERRLDYWHRVRDCKSDNPALAAFRFLFLIKTCFGGQVEPPMGGYQQTGWKGRGNRGLACQYAVDTVLTNLHEARRLLAGRTSVTNLDVFEFLNMAEPASFYFDPPYFPGTSNLLYRSGMTLDEHRELAQLLREFPCAWLLSYDSSAAVRTLYSWATTIEITAKYSHSPGPSPWKHKIELLIFRNSAGRTAEPVRDCIHCRTPEPANKFCGQPYASPRSSKMTEAMDAFCNESRRMKNNNKSETRKAKAKQMEAASSDNEVAPKPNNDTPAINGTDGAGKGTRKTGAVTEGTANVFTPTSMAPTTPQQVERLAKFEAVVEKNLKSLFALGEALQVIRDEQLYRESFDTFEEYCHARWGFSRIWAHYQINAATTRLTLLTTVNNDALREPKNERQLRPLSKLKPEQWAAAWKRACEIAGQSEVNHSHADQAVAEIKGEAPGNKSKKHRKENADQLPAMPGTETGKADDPEGDQDDAQAEDEHWMDGEVDEKLVLSACRRIDAFVAGEVKMFSGPERAKVANELRALADKICV